MIQISAKYNFEEVQKDRLVLYSYYVLFSVVFLVTKFHISFKKYFYLKYFFDHCNHLIGKVKSIQNSKDFDCSSNFHCLSDIFMKSHFHVRASHLNPPYIFMIFLI